MLWQWLHETLYTIFQSLANHILLYHEVMETLLKAGCDIGDQGMIEHRQCFHLSLKVAYILLLLLRVRAWRNQFFNCNQLISNTGITCQNSFTHSSLAKKFFHYVATALQISIRKRMLRFLIISIDVFF